MKGVSYLSLRSASLLLPLFPLPSPRETDPACWCRKRPTPRSPSLSPDLLALWTPLITHLDSLPSASSSSTTFSDVLIKRGLDILCTLEGGETADKSYVACVSAWAGELVKDAPVSLEPEGEEEEGEGGEGGVSLKGVIKSCLLARTPACVFRTLYQSTHG